MNTQDTTVMPIADIGGRDLQHYNPEQGLKSIADAEAGQKRWERAKDRQKIVEAITDKIAAVTDYVEWRDAGMAQVRAGPGRGKKQPAPARLVLPQGDPGQDVIDRWRRNYCTRDETGRT